MSAASPTIVHPINPAASRVGTSRALLPALYLAGLAPRLWDVAGRSLVFDELFSVGVSSLPIEQFLAAQWVESNMALFHWLLFGWIRFVGPGADEARLRLLSVLIGATAVPLTFVLGRRLHSPAAGLYAAILLATHPFHAVLSQEARAYGLFCSLVLGSYVLLDQAMVRGRRRDWLLHGLVMALAFYAHFFAALGIVAQWVFVLSRRSRAALLGTLLSSLVAALLLVQLLPFLVTSPNASRLGFLSFPTLSYAGTVALRYGGGQLWLAVAYLVLSVVGLVVAKGANRSASYRSWMLLAWLVVPVGLAVGVSLVKPIFRDRYLFAVLPVLPLLAGIGLATLPRRPGAIALLLVVGFSLSTLHETLPTRPEREWPRAVSEALSQAQPSDGWIFLSPLGQYGFDHYARRLDNLSLLAPPAEHVFAPIDWLAASREPEYLSRTSFPALGRFAQAHPRIWLVESNDISDDVPRVRRWLRLNNYEQTYRRDFDDPSIMLFTRLR